MTQQQQASPEEKAAAGAMLSALEQFLQIDATASVQMVSAYLRVVIHEGEDVTEYTRRAGVAPSVMSRHLLDLGEMDRRHEPGLNLIIQKTDPMTVAAISRC